MSDNPTYKDRGLMLSEQEHQWIHTGLQLLGEKIQAEHPQEIDKLGPIGRLAIRIGHVVHGGEGIPEAITERYTRLLDRAMLSGNPDATARALAALFAAVIRLDPDPAEHLGTMLVQMMNANAKLESHAYMVGWLGRLQEILQTAKMDFDAGAYPSAAETLQWTIDTVTAGADDLRGGHEPWSTAAHEEPGDDTEGASEPASH